MLPRRTTFASWTLQTRAPESQPPCPAPPRASSSQRGGFEASLEVRRGRVPTVSSSLCKHSALRTQSSWEPGGRGAGFISASG